MVSFGKFVPLGVVAGGAVDVGGQLLQITRTTFGKVSTTAVIPADDTIPQITEGLEVYSAAFTPLSSTSTLYFAIDSNIVGSTLANHTAALFVDTTADAIAAKNVYTGANLEQMYMLFSVASGSTSARTYKVRMGPSTGTFQNYRTTEDDAGGSDELSALIIMEVEG